VLELEMDLDLIEFGDVLVSVLIRYTVAPGTVIQVNDVFAGVEPAVLRSQAVIRAMSPTARWTAYASVVDNGTGDPVLVLPAEASTEALIIPAAAHSAGVNGTRWRTELALHNRGPTPLQLRIDLLAANQDNREPRSVSVAVECWRSVYLDDVLGTTFGHTGAAALRLVPEGGAIMASSRTYTESGSGSYGQHIPAVPLSATAAGATAEQVAYLLGLHHSPDPERGFRTNLGFVNLSDSWSRLQVVLTRSDGTALGELEVELPPWSFLQRADVLSACSDLEVANASARILSLDATRFLAYASIVDNQTGDPVLRLAVPGTASGGFTH
jgi:hypothetical protein